MATYIEIRNLINDATLRNKAGAAVIIAAQGIMDDVANFPTPSAGDTVLEQDRLAWAARAFNGPETEARKVLMSMLAANNAASVAAITGATDALIQTNVNAAVDLLAQHDKPV